MLLGEQRKKLSRYDIQYYFENMKLYAQKVTEAVTPFQNALSVISSEVRKFGGCGSVHGCIVDIDYFNHIYLNPFDGTFTMYYALNTMQKYVCNDMISLLKDRLPKLCEQYESAKISGFLPIVSQFDGKNKKSKIKWLSLKYLNLF